MRYLSLFSGMECAWQAWHPLGWECAGVAEIDPNACALLRHRLPNVPNLGSVTDITEAAIQKLGRLGSENRLIVRRRKAAWSVRHDRRFRTHWMKPRGAK